MAVDLRNNKRALCPYCPMSLRCVAMGLEPLNIQIDVMDAHKTIELMQEQRYMWGARTIRVHCEAYRGPGSPPGWRPKGVDFYVDREVIMGKEADDVRRQHSRTRSEQTDTDVR